MASLVYQRKCRNCQTPKYSKCCFVYTFIYQNYMEIHILFELKVGTILAFIEVYHRQ